MSAFADAWRIYHAAGWPVIPTLPGTKRPAISGITGYFGVDLTADELDEIASKDEDYGIAIRMPETCIGLDIDAYDGKQGDKTLATLIEKFGPLPAAWRSTARHDDPISGIRLFRVPPGEYADPGEHIEIVRRHHRLAMVWPSINFKTNTMYRWFTPNGDLADEGVVPTWKS